MGTRTMQTMKSAVFALAALLCLSQAARADASVAATVVHADDSSQAEPVQDQPAVTHVQFSSAQPQPLAQSNTQPLAQHTQAPQALVTQPLAPQPMAAQAPSFEETTEAVDAPHITRVRGVSPRAGLMLGAFGIQQPVRGDVMIRVHDYLAFGASIGGIPEGLGGALLSAAKVSNGTLSALSADGSLFVFPFRGSFFLGASLGRMGLSASATTTSGAQTGTIFIDAHETYLTPRAGWFATWDSGFSFGFDLGAQLPLDTQIVTTGTSSKASNVDSLVHAVAGLPLPTVAVRLGWML
ncbi:MAG: hypothetical protein JST92_15415 [Deltaproteobacteria bacterium]|nr:hypothetical protein [Deltaproteobacteria bacterium]